jgi:dienelactone hydrolase
MLLASCGQPAGPSQDIPEDIYVLTLPPVDPEEHLHLFDYDPQAPLDIQEGESWREGEVAYNDLTYASPKGGRVPATIMVPDGKGPFAGIIVMHGMPSKRQDVYWVGELFARHGAVVILIDAPFARPGNWRPASRGVPLFWSERDSEEQIQLIVDLRRAVDLLMARPDVDAERIAYVGGSYGGAMGGLLAGVEDRLQAYALMSGDGGLVTHLTGPDDVAMHSYIGSSFLLLSDERRQLWLEAMWPIEPIHYVGRAAPAALFFQNGLRDSAVPTYDARLYQQAGSEPKDILWYDSGHGLPPEAFRDQLKWVHRHVSAGVFLLGPNYRASAVLPDRLLLGWLLLAAGALVFLLWDLTRRQELSWGRKLAWVLVAVLFGPIGLLAYLFSDRWSVQAVKGPVPIGWRALAAALYSTTGYVVALVPLAAALVYFRLEPSPVISLAASYVAPFLVGLLIFRAIPLAALQGGRYGEVLRRGILAEVISLNLCLAAIFPLNVFLMNRWFVFYPDLGSPVFWAIIALTATAGAVLLFPYTAWMTHRGFTLWPGRQAAGEATGDLDRAVVLPSLRSTWWVLLLSIALLAASIGLIVVSQL